MAEKWMQKVSSTMEKGGLHRSLHVPLDKKIPAKKLTSARHSRDPKIRRQAGLARAFASARHSGR